MLNVDIWEKNQKNFLRPVHNLKSSDPTENSYVGHNIGSYEESYLGSYIGPT